jgi:hypothetical protein
VATSISQFVNSVKEGMALSTQYEVTFLFQDDTTKSAVQKVIDDSSSTTFSGDGLITTLCNEAQLPGVSSLTGQTNGLYLGEGQVNYSYGKLFTDISLGWHCDKYMVPLKFLQAWHDSQFTENMVRIGQGEAVTRSSFKNRVRYPKSYQANIIIKKDEIDQTGEFKSIVYTLLDAFPYSIDATPLSFGTSQLLNVSASFYYSKYVVDTFSKTKNDNYLKKLIDKLRGR